METGYTKKVQRFLDGLPDISRSADKWDYYEDYKKQLSNLCGFDAPAGEYNQALYERASEEMSRRLGLRGYSGFEP